MEPYWIVVSLQRGLVGTPKHYRSPKEAVAEARRLAMAMPGESFDVFLSVKRAKHGPVQVEDFDNSEEPPF